MSWSEPERLRATLASMLDMHVLMEAVRDDSGTIVDFTIVDGNDAFFEFVRQPADQVLDTRLLDLVPGQRESGLLAAYAHAVDTGELMELDTIPYHDEVKGGALRYYDLRGVKYGDALSITWRDVTDRVESIEALASSEQHYRLLAENSSDVVYETDSDAVIRWVSPSAARVLGWASDEMVGHNAFEFIDPRYSPDPAELLDRVRGGHATSSHVQSFRTKAGPPRWMRVDARPIVGADGATTAVVVALHDSHDEVVVRRAYDTLAAVNEVLVRALNEEDLLGEICEIAVTRGGYLFAWYGRKGPPPDCAVEAVASSAALRDYLDEIAVTWDSGPTGQGPTGRALREGTTQVLSDFAEGGFAPWRDAALRRGFHSSASVPIVVHGELDGAWMVYAPEPDAFTEDALAVLGEMAQQLGLGLARLRDERRIEESVRQQALLFTAIDQATETVIVTDPEGRIVYVNPATTVSTGYTVDELIGATPRVVMSGAQDAAFYRSLMRDLLDGHDWHGVLVNRRKNGELFEEDVAVSPVTDESGEVIALVAVKRDLTDQRRLEHELSQDQRDRAAVVALMDEVGPAATVEATATAFCDAVCRLDHVDAASIMLLEPHGELVVAGIANRLHEPLMKAGAPAPVRGGDWIGDLGDRRVRFEDLDDPETLAHEGFSAAAHAAGLVAVAAAGIQWDGRVLGVLSLGTATPEGRERLRTRTALVDEVATFASSLFGHAVAERLDAETTRDDLRTILAGRRFHPEFQPVVDLATGTVHGYEALARFDDGTRPDLEFARARAVGLGSELEAACAAAALVAAEAVPAEMWVSVNFSPDALLDGTAAAVLRDVTRPVVIEITEHAVIEHYEDVRRAAAACGDARLSVDDAGAGFASLRHILELAPAFVKLDLGLVRDIDRDPARQALAAGLVHFATQTGIVLIAEGIETEAEAQTLRVLGVRLGQGYLFGRPAPLA